MSDRIIDYIENLKVLAKSTQDDYRSLASFIKKNPELEHFPTLRDKQAEYFTRFNRLCPTNMSNSTRVKMLSKYSAMANVIEGFEVYVKPRRFVLGGLEKQHEIFLTHKEVLALRHFPTEDLSKTERYVRDLFVFACYTGLRSSELEYFNTSHLKMGGDKPYIYMAMPKVQRAKVVPLNEYCVEKIKQYVPEELDQDKAVSVFSMKQYLKGNYINTVIKRICRKIHDKNGTFGRTEKVTKFLNGTIREFKTPIYNKVSFHIARHTYGAILLDKGVSIAKVSKVLGHKKVTTTEQWYTHLYKDRVIEDVYLAISAT